MTRDCEWTNTLCMLSGLFWGGLKSREQMLAGSEQNLLVFHVSIMLPGTCVFVLGRIVSSFRGVQHVPALSRPIWYAAGNRTLHTVALDNVQDTRQMGKAVSRVPGAGLDARSPSRCILQGIRCGRYCSGRSFEAGIMTCQRLHFINCPRQCGASQLITSHGIPACRSTPNLGAQPLD